MMAGPRGPSCMRCQNSASRLLPMSMAKCATFWNSRGTGWSCRGVGYRNGVNCASLSTPLFPPPLPPRPPRPPPLFLPPRPPPRPPKRPISLWSLVSPSVRLSLPLTPPPARTTPRYTLLAVCARAACCVLCVVPARAYCWRLWMGGPWREIGKKKRKKGAFFLWSSCMRFSCAPPVFFSGLFDLFKISG